VPALPPPQLEALDREAYLSLASFRRSGRAVETPVWFALQAGSLYVFTAGDSGKVKRLRRDSRVRVAPCTARGRVKGAWIEGRARLVAEPETEVAAYGALARKYGWQMHLTNLLSRLVGRIHKRIVIEIAL
jgi:PPOX class probable F420-dependent enzyme